MPTKKMKIFSIAGFIILVCIIVALFLWLKPKTDDNQTSTVIQQTTATASLQPLSATTQSIALQSNSQLDTQVNCQMSIDRQGYLLVNERTKDCFEYFISQYGEKDLTHINTDFIAYIQTNYKTPASTQIIDLWTRYLNYRKKLTAFDTPSAAQHNAQYYQSIFNQTNLLRKQYFSQHEIEGLFGQTVIYDQYTLDRLAILEDQSLSEVEKAKRLNVLLKNLPQDWQDNIEQSTQLETLRQLTSDIKARGGSAQDIRHMRINLVGIDATNRLEILDTQRSQWKNQVTQYLSERDAILHSGLIDSAKQDAIRDLKQNYFDNPQQQLRLETFESIHDKGGKLPFAE